MQYVTQPTVNDEASLLQSDMIPLSLPTLQQHCGGGFRKGEMIVLSGPTGSGKTTLLSQLSLDFVIAGAPTLWGSFEVKNHILLLKMLKQFSKTQSIDTLSSPILTQLMDDFESLPLQFMNYHGATNVDELIETIEYAVNKDDIQYIIIDNIQFLMPRMYRQSPPSSTSNSNNNNTNSLFDRLELQDYILDRLRQFASEKNVTIFVVIHPRKQEDGMELGLSSIGGTAKASQEADLVLILQVQFHSKLL